MGEMALLFLITLGVYFVATAATAFSKSPMFFFACRFFTGAGIGGEYAANKSTSSSRHGARSRRPHHQRLVLARHRVRCGPVGVAADKNQFSADVGFRLAFELGGPR
jgi:MFS family permease